MSATTHPVTQCRNPHCTQPPATRPRRKDYCIACASYRAKYQRHRPEHVIERYYTRVITRLQYDQH